MEKGQVYRFYKFLEKKEGRAIPLKLKLIHAPESLTPEELKVGGDLDLMGTKIKSLPDDLQVGGDLDLEGTPIKSLPPGLQIGRHLYLSGTPIKSLPPDLKVDGNLYFHLFLLAPALV